MGRGTTLATLRYMLKSEIGHNLQTNVATAQDTELNQLLADMQQWVWSQYRWPFLYSHADVAATATTRYLTAPTAISLDYPTKVEAKWGQLWFDVDYGISGEEYQVVDPDRQQTRDPIARWQIYSSTQIEVWPVPSTVQTLRFWGTKTLNALASDTDTADLDDLLIVLFAAAEKLSRAKLADAPAKLNRAQQLFHRLRGADRPNTIFTLGGDGDETSRSGTRYATIFSNQNH